MEETPMIHTDNVDRVIKSEQNLEAIKNFLVDNIFYMTSFYI